jgi:hypothetical protein
VVRPNQVWGIDIAAIRLARGFTLPGGDHRRVQPQGLKPANQQQYGGEILHRLPGRGTVRTHGRPETRKPAVHPHGFSGVLTREGITISMDLPAPSKARQAGGRGRALDNIFIERLWRSLK